MTKKAKISIAAAVSAALLFGGSFIFFKDDIAQKKADSDISPYRPTPEIQHELDVISADLMTEAATAVESAPPETVTSVVTEKAAVVLPDEPYRFSTVAEFCLSQCHRLAVYPEYKNKLSYNAGRG